MSRPVAAQFGDIASLLGYDLEPCSWSDGACSTAGETLSLRLVWQATAETGTRYRAFAHVLCGDEIVAQSDGQPGPLPTTAWLPGQVTEDVHPLSLPADTCPTGLRLLVGLYDPETGERLSPSGALESEDGRLVLASIAAR